MSKRLTENIELRDDERFFRLDNKGRCAFLNDDGLCDIIIELGKDYLCNICAEHPRFHNYLSDRVETGIGICCEEACRVILEKKTPFHLEFTDDDENSYDDEYEYDNEDTYDNEDAYGDEESDDFEDADHIEDEYYVSHDECYMIELRDRLFEIARDRGHSMDERCDEILGFLEVKFPDLSFEELGEVFNSLEMFDESWRDVIAVLSSATEFAPIDVEYEVPFEQLLCYFIYRHVACAQDFTDVSVRGAFAVLCVRVINTLFCALDGDFTFLLDLCRRFSVEIEYNEANTEYLLELIYRFNV